MRLRTRSTARPALLAGLIALAAAVSATPAVADAGQGQKLFDSNKCGSCHQMTGPVAAIPIAQRAQIKGPPLWFAGSKFKREWLSAWLAAPKPIARVKYGTLEIGANPHQALPAAQAADVAAYLATRTDPEVKSGQVGAAAPSRRALFTAETLFSKKQVCFGCHQYPSKSGSIGGYSGPSLVDAGQRLNPDWIYAFLKDNARYYPNGRMPVYGKEAFNAFSEDEVKLLAQYIGHM